LQHPTIAGKKRNQRKATSAKGTDTSPRRGAKLKQRRQNTGEKDILDQELQPSPAVTRNANKASTDMAVEAAETFQPKKLDPTFQLMDANHDKDDDADDNQSIDSATDDDANTVLKQLQDNPDDTTDSEENKKQTSYTCTKNQKPTKSNKKAHDDEQNQINKKMMTPPPTRILMTKMATMTIVTQRPKY
jgi:hypothetical protein